MTQREKNVLAVDVGGSKICFGLVTPEGQILARQQYETQRMEAPQWTRQLMDHLTPFLEQQGGAEALAAMGLGIRGSVDHRSQRLRTSSVIRNAAQFDICGTLSQAYGLPVYMDNDVKAVALYQLLFGVGRQRKTFACINVGTGLAMGLVMDGVLIRGCCNNAGEIGNMLYARPGDGVIDFVETVASGQGIDQERRRLEAQMGPADCGPTGKALAEACRRGDPVAEAVFDNVVGQLALILLNLEAALDIGTYILVGGVMTDPWLRQRLTQQIMSISRQKQTGCFRWQAELLVPQAGPAAGLCGAAGVAYYALKNKEDNHCNA